MTATVGVNVGPEVVHSLVSHGANIRHEWDTITGPPHWETMMRWRASRRQRLRLNRVPLRR